MPDASDNFESAQGRAWDILAVAMGGGAVGIGVVYGMGHERFIKKPQNGSR